MKLNSNILVILCQVRKCIFSDDTLDECLLCNVSVYDGKACNIYFQDQ